MGPLSSRAQKRRHIRAVQVKLRCAAIDLICREGSGCETDSLFGGMEIGEPAFRIAHNHLWSFGNRMRESRGCRGIRV